MGLVIMGLGGIILGIFFILAVRRVWGTGQGNPDKSYEE